MIIRVLAAFALAFAGAQASASTYLNDDAGVTVSLGSSMPAQVDCPTINIFNNVCDAESLANTIDVDNATDSEVHNQSSHVWYTSSVLPLEFDFDLGAQYDLTTMHFWNYFTETFSVDEIQFSLFDAASASVGGIIINPTEGVSPASEIIDPADYAFAFDNVRYINALFSGTNGQVDFNNIGWTGSRSDNVPPPIPLPAGFPLLAIGVGVLGLLSRRRKSQSS